jgi:OFA family oxalate/formate antiporter-like MFS transporter
VSSQAVSAPTPNRWVVAVAAVLMQLGLGAVYAWSIFRVPLSEHYGTGITAVNWAFFITILMIGFAAFAGGQLMQRVGPRVVGALGGVVYGIGVALAYFAQDSLVVLYLTYGFIAGVGLGLAYIIPIQVLPKWFPDRPGFATGIAVMGFGLGSAVTVPVAGYLVPAVGLFGTFGILGLIYIFFVGGAGFLITNPPEGYSPEGHEPSEEESSQEEERTYDFGGALRTWQWYALWAMLFLNVTAGLSIISDAKAIASELGGSTATLASAFVVILAVANAAGRLGWATFSDYIGPRNVFLTMFLLQAVLFLLIPLVGRDVFWLLTILSFIILTCYGGGFSTMPTFAGAYFGSQNVGTIYGAMLTAWGLATLLGPLILAISTDITGTYDLALYISAGIMLVSSIIPLIIRPPEAPQKEAEAGTEAEARA